MKKKIFAITTALVAVVTLSAFTVNNASLTEAVVEKGLQTAVEKGFATSEQAAVIQESGIIQESLQIFLDTGDASAAIDHAAEIAVKQGWAKDKQSAKRQVRREIEKARKNDTLMSKAYQFLGL